MLPTVLSIPAFIIGVLLLWKGSDILVDGTSKTALSLGISSLIVSVLLVGFGTSAPEFAISVGAAIKNDPTTQGISLGNVIGSCIANLFLVLGLSSIIKPIKIQKKIIKREVPIVLGATSLLVVSSFFGLLDDYHVIGGIIFIILFVLFVWFFINCAKKERIKDEKVNVNKTSKNLFFIFLGIIGVVAGAYLLIESAVTIADILKISPFIIALSMVAIGTSLPELVVSVMAAHKDESDIAVGNVLGSNVFNILLILGVAALFIPLGATGWGISGTLDDILILLILTFIAVPILYSGHSISRLEGVAMLSIYVFYIWYIFYGCTIIFPQTC